MFSDALSGGDGILKTSTGTAWMRNSMLGQFMGEVEGDVWHDVRMPALIPIFSPGDQGVFIYIGKPDDDGMFPVFRYDDEPCAWISSPNVIAHALGHDSSELTEAAEARNAHFTAQEWWADTPGMKEFWSLMENS